MEMSLDLDQLEAEAKKHNAEFDNLACSYEIELNKKILSLISSIRIKDKLLELAKVELEIALKREERLQSAEKALKTYATNQWDDATSLGDYDDQGYGKTARAHFERFKEER